MAALRSRCGHSIFVLWFLLSSVYLYSFFLAYSQPSQIGCLPYFHTWCGLSSNSGCRLKRAASGSLEMHDAKNGQKFAICAPSACQAYCCWTFPTVTSNVTWTLIASVNNVHVKRGQMLEAEAKYGLASCLTSLVNKHSASIHITDVLIPSSRLQVIRWMRLCCCTS